MLRYAGRTIVRVLITVLVVAALSYVGIGRAHAGTPQQAMQMCADYDANTYSGTVACTDIGSFNHDNQCAPTTPRSPDVGTVCGKRTNEFNQSDGAVGFSYDMPVCTPPMEYDTATHQCVDKQAACLARNADIPRTNAIPFTGHQCIQGCQYGGINSGTADGVTYGSVGYTGQTCTTNTPNPVDPSIENPQVCTPAGGGMTFCVKPNGDHCYSASTGRQICWDPGETGTKTDGPVQQTRGPGTTPPATPPPPPGETTSPGTGPKTVNTTTPGGTNITTTTINNVTNNGTNGGPTNDGEPSDGDGDEGSAGGGEGCEAPPSCSGDAVGCATLIQVWRSRCSEGKNKIEGGAECDANGNPVFVCTGDQVMCKTALTTATQLCLARKGDGNGDGLADVLEVEGDGIGDMGTSEGTGTTHALGIGMLDQGGFLGAPACPTLGTVDFGVFGSFDLDAQTWICDFTNLAYWAHLLIGAFLAFCIVSGRIF